MKLFSTSAGWVQLGDRVEVLRGPDAGAEGTVVWLHNDNTINIHLHQPGLEYHEVRVGISDVRKKHHQGDYVEVVHGEYVGYRGFVFELDDEVATLLMPGDSHGHVGLLSNHRSMAWLTLALVVEG
jgi:transcription elongation factor